MAEIEPKDDHVGEGGDGTDVTLPVDVPLPPVVEQEDDEDEGS